MSAPFYFGQVVERREVLDDKVWLSYPVRVVADSPDCFAVYLAQGTRLNYGYCRWGPHPWQAIGDRWLSPGVLQLHWPGIAHSIWTLRDRGSGEFAAWYVNFQAPIRRFASGFDTLDHELDMLIPREGGSYAWKDVERFEARVAEGEFTPAQAIAIREEAGRVSAMLERGEQWWDPDWRRWQPPPHWTALPD